MGERALSIDGPIGQRAVERRKGFVCLLWLILLIYGATEPGGSVP